MGRHELTPPDFRRTLTPTMPSGFDAAFAKVKELVADFRANEQFYLSPAYQEQEARRDFIDKFWLALGWDINHETQKNPIDELRLAGQFKVGLPLQPLSQRKRIRKRNSASPKSSATSKSCWR